MWIPTVKDIKQLVKQPEKLLTVKEDATVAEAAKKMSNNQIGCLVVFDMQDKFSGVLTERDMLAKVLATSLSPNGIPVRDIMTTGAISCNIDTTIAKVEQLMAEHKIRHVPIVEDGVPVGMISSRDVIAYRLHSNKAMKVVAEQIAMLSTGLKSLDFDDVIALAINEVPKSFEADWAILCFAQKGSSAPTIYRKGCPISQDYLLSPWKMKQLSQNEQVICSEICDKCQKLGGQAPGLIIPLNICEQPADHNSSNAGTPFCDILQNGNPVSSDGFLCMCRFNPSSTGSEALHLYKASLLQEVLSVNLTNAKLYQNYQQARRDSEIDSLTDVGTRRFLDKVLITEYSRALRYNRPFSVAIVDLDNFKEINDNAGHAAGDRTLQQLAKIMRRNVRMTDIIIARYGGDEFVLLMPETNLNEATGLLERLRSQVKNISIPNVQSITISCGVAEWSGSAAESAQQIFKRADAALYEAKHTGRNCVIASEPAPNAI